MKIVVNCKIVEEVLGPFLGGILPSFLGSIFDPFSDFSLRAICLFYGVSCPSKVVFGPFLDLFWDVHLSMILPPFTSVELRSVMQPGLAGRRLG
jgi:hypothetical protein